MEPRTEQTTGEGRGRARGEEEANVWTGNGQRRELRRYELSEKAQRRARRLGWFSLGLGLAHLLSPRGMSRIALGGDDRRKRNVMLAIGARELACGIGLLTQPRPAGWMWTRFAGDLMDLALLGTALTSRHTQTTAIARSMAAIVGVTILDVATSVQLTRANRAEARVGRALRFTKAITVNRPPEEVYKFWRNFQNLPRFMAHLEQIEVRDDRRSHWIARGPGGKAVEWDAEIVDDRPNQVISWRSMAGADVPNWGTVRFQRAAGARGTEIRVSLSYEPPGGLLGASLAKLFGKNPEQQVDGDLRRFKQVIEVGEVVHSDASIHSGRHPAQPPERRPSNGKGVIR